MGALSTATCVPRAPARAVFKLLSEVVVVSMNLAGTPVRIPGNIPGSTRSGTTFY